MLRMNDCHYGDEELLVILKRKDTKVVREMKWILSKKDVKDCFVDFGQGDKFQIQDISYDVNSHAMELKVSRHSVRWIEMGVKHPIKLTNDE